MNNAVWEVQMNSGLKIKSRSTTLEADECKELGVFSGREQCWKPAASNVLGLTGTRGEELTLRISSPFCIQPLQHSSLKSATLVIFTPWKLATATTQGSPARTGC